MTLSGETDERLVRHDEISLTFDEALARAGVSQSALLLSGNVVCTVFSWSRSTKDRRIAEGVLPTVRDGGRVRHPRKPTEALYRRMVEGASA